MCVADPDVGLQRGAQLHVAAYCAAGCLPLVICPCMQFSVQAMREAYVTELMALPIAAALG